MIQENIPGLPEPTRAVLPWMNWKKCLDEMIGRQNALGLITEIGEEVVEVKTKEGKIIMRFVSLNHIKMAFEETAKKHGFDFLELTIVKNNGN